MQPRFPFLGNPKVARRNAKLHRLKRKGLIPPTDKQSLREAAEQAIATHPIRKA